MIATHHQAMTETLHVQMPFSEHLEITLIEADIARVITAADWKPEYCGIGGVLHGGYLMALADSNGATLAFLNLAAGETTTTVESKTNFFRPTTAGSVAATSTMVHRGRTTMAVQTDIVNDHGALVCRTLQTQLVRAATS